MRRDPVALYSRPMTPAQLKRRREPSQVRGHLRVKALLDATAQLLEEAGYDALTTKAIAERAETSIGSFYQFFPNRDAAVAALVDGYRADVRDYLQTHVREHFRNTRVGITADWVGSVVDGLSALYASFPGFRGFWSGAITDGPLAVQAEQLRAELLSSLEELMGERFPEVDAERRHRCLVMVVETAKSVLNRLEAFEGPTRELLRQELKEMLALYMAAYFEPASGA
jgi:AcrR family transcriptional regulator